MVITNQPAGIGQDGVGLLEVGDASRSVGEGVKVGSLGRGVRIMAVGEFVVNGVKLSLIHI